MSFFPVGDQKKNGCRLRWVCVVFSVLLLPDVSAALDSEDLSHIQALCSPAPDVFLALPLSLPSH